MKKIVFTVVAVLIVAAAILFLVLKKDKTPEPQTAAVENTATAAAPNDIPKLHLTLLNGEQLQSQNLTGKTVMILFQPDCDHCQRESTQIREHLNAFNDYAVYFVSDAELDRMSQFAQEYGLAQSSNVHFAHTSTNEVLDGFGSIPVPAVYIFSERGRLINSFVGETPIEEILKYL